METVHVFYTPACNPLKPENTTPIKMKRVPNLGETLVLHSEESRETVTWYRVEEKIHYLDNIYIRLELSQVQMAV